MILFLAAVASQAAVSDQPINLESWTWATVSRSRGMRSGEHALTIRIGTVPRHPADYSNSSLTYWFEQRVEPEQGEARLSWTDTRRCPQAISALNGLRNLEPPRFAPLSTDDDLAMVLDGRVYSIVAPSRYGGTEGGPMSIQSNLGTPLADWVDRLLATLASCWSRDRPQVRR